MKRLFLAGLLLWKNSRVSASLESRPGDSEVVDSEVVDSEVVDSEVVDSEVANSSYYYCILNL